MRKNIFLVLAAVAFLWLAGAGNKALLKLRADCRLDGVGSLENTPPLMALTTVTLGGFRGLIADALWLRISKLQDEGKYFEVVQLSDWITKLEPLNTEIWAFHAWNMAYNISVTMSEPEDRLRWVNNGIRLLRDEGIRYNPGDPLLYAELGWLYQHKIGGETDTAAGYYKRQLAGEMTDPLGSRRLGPDKTAATPEVLEKLRDEYRLLPELMLELDSKYGPLDWRLPQSHALYWAYAGTLHAPGNKNLTCDRMIYQSMTDMFIRGNLTFEPEANIYRTTPLPDILPAVLKSYKSALEKHDDDSIRTAYANFLANAIQLLNSLDRKEQAAELTALLVRHRESSAGSERK